MPNVQLVVLDTLLKVIRVSDVNDYMPVLSATEKIHDLARKTGVHIQGVCHCKKSVPLDPFDSLLGSTALRGEPDTSLVVYQDAAGQRLVATESRIGRGIQPTFLEANITQVAGCDLVSSFSLGGDHADWKNEQASNNDKKRKSSYEQRIIAFLTNRDNGSATYQHTLDEVTGRKERLAEAIQTLLTAKVIRTSGTKNSPIDPLTLKLDRNALRMHDFIDQHGGNE